jgi:hypothetical protein
MCCELAGISEQMFFKWRREDPAFSAEVLRLTQESVFSLIDTLKLASQQSWRSTAFLLERRWARFYGRPETQLNLALAVQNNMNAGSNAGVSLETVIPSNLEYSRLRARIPPTSITKPSIRPTRSRWKAETARVDPTDPSLVRDRLPAVLIASRWHH